LMDAASYVGMPTLNAPMKRANHARQLTII
jgi:hypothetical protein